jgi:hypothetical protein
MEKKLVGYISSFIVGLTSLINLIIFFISYHSVTKNASSDIAAFSGFGLAMAFFELMPITILSFIIGYQLYKIKKIDYKKSIISLIILNLIIFILITCQILAITGFENSLTHSASVIFIFSHWPIIIFYAIILGKLSNIKNRQS